MYFYVPQSLVRGGRQRPAAARVAPAGAGPDRAGSVALKTDCSTVFVMLFSKLRCLNDFSIHCYLAPLKSSLCKQIGLFWQPDIKFYQQCKLYNGLCVL